MIPSTVSWVLSLVMQTWLGTSSGTSFSECLYATRSTNGTTNASPGVSVRSYLPSFSTIQACCCGTILIARITNSTAMTAMTRATSMMGGLPFVHSVVVVQFAATGSSTSQLPSTATMRCSPDV